MTRVEVADARLVLIVTVLWTVGALGASLVAPLESLPRPALQGILVGLTIAALAATRWAPPFRRWTVAADARVLIAVHLTRWIGVYFLCLHQQGRLPFAFAVPGGWGDIVVAIGATTLVAAGQSDRPARRRLILAWNVLGLIDILWVIATATWLGLTNPESMRELARFPLNLLPLLIVPVILVTHTVMLFRVKTA